MTISTILGFYKIRGRKVYKKILFIGSYTESFLESSQNQGLLT